MKRQVFLTLDTLMFVSAYSTFLFKRFDVAIQLMQLVFARTYPGDILTSSRV